MATVVGSGMMAERLTHDAALALLCNTLPTGAVLVVLIALLGPISGAHLNPVVTAAFALKREIAPGDAALYVVGQMAGAIGGTAIAQFAAPIVELSETVRADPNLWLSESVATFGLISVVLAGLRLRPDSLPWLVGLYIVSAYWFTASTSFANPAVTVARTLTASFSGIRPIDAPAFIISQFVGALAALTLMKRLLLQVEEESGG